MPVALTGDFNFNPSSKEYKMLSDLLEDSYILCNNAKEEKEITFHEFSGATSLNDSPSKEGRIDFIWVNEKCNPVEVRIVHDFAENDSGIFPSDHWPVFGVLQCTQD